MFRRFAPAVAVVALTSALTLPPAAEAKPRLTQSRAESAMWRYAARAYSRRLAGRYVYADCSRVTRTFFDCTYAAMVTEAESFDCGYKQGLGEPVPDQWPDRRGAWGINAGRVHAHLPGEAGGHGRSPSALLVARAERLGQARSG